MKGYDRRFGMEPKEHEAVEDNSLKMLVIGLVVLAVVLALV